VASTKNNQEELRMFGKFLAVVWVGLLALLLLSACGGWYVSPERKEASEVRQTIFRFKNADPGIEAFLNDSYGYAVFPTVGKGGFFLGGGYGTGVVYEQGKLVGHARLIKLTVGAQIGGQAFSEILFFQDKAALDAFKAGNLVFESQVTAVIATQRATKGYTFNNGVAGFSLPRVGAMAEATIGGQQFQFEPSQGR
jgi:lipid-binding SYLF domain-containing protein